MEPRRVGRYLVGEEIASGGAATVHLGRLLGPSGFARTVAIKALHPALARDPRGCAMLLDEARLGGRVRHPNVVPVVDLVPEGPEPLLVMEYVHGESLARLLSASVARDEAVPPNIAVTIACEMLAALHAAHEARAEDGTPLGIVHRDVSPQNVLVGADGVARVADFGIAKAAGRLSATVEGEVKGKLAYMAPEQLRGAPVDRRADVWGAGVVLWEALAGRRLFAADSAAASMTLVLEKPIPPPSAVARSSSAGAIPAALDDVVLRALARDPDARFPTAASMAEAVTAAAGRREPAPVIARWVESLVAPALARRADLVARLERTSPEDEPTTPFVASAAPRRWPRRALVALAGAGTLAVALGFAYRAGASARTATASAPSTTTAAPSAPAMPPPPTTSAAPTPGPTSTTSARAAPSFSPPRPRSRSRPSCDPPYTVDQGGFHIPKPACL